MTTATLSLPIPSALRSWCDSMALRSSSQEIAPLTAKLYEAGARRYLAWCARNGQPWYTPDSLRAWKADELQEWKPASVNAWLSGVRAWCAWLVETERIPSNPFISVKSAAQKGRRSHHAREALTVDEIRRLLALPDTETPGGKRDLAILALMAYTGVRTVECYRAEIKDLETRSGKLILNIQGKGRVEADEFVVIEPKPEAMLRDWLIQRGREQGPIFVSVSNRTRGEKLSLRAIRWRVKEYYKLAGIVGNKTTHSLRHTAITTAILKGAPLQKVKALARHASLDTTMIYYHEIDRLDNPAEAYIDYD
jgi:integrase/recombinase XerD